MPATATLSVAVIAAMTMIVRAHVHMYAYNTIASLFTTTSCHRAAATCFLSQGLVRSMSTTTLSATRFSGPVVQMQKLSSFHLNQK